MSLSLWPSSIILIALCKMMCWTQVVSMATAQASLRWHDGGAKWVYRHPANPFAMPAEFLAVAPFVIYGHACMDARQEQQSAQTNLMISAKTVTLMPRNVPSLMVSFCSISLMAASCLLRLHGAQNSG